MDIPELRQEMPRMAKKLQAKLRLKRFDHDALFQAIESYIKRCEGIGTQRANLMSLEYGAFLGHCIVTMKKGITFGPTGQMYFLSYDNPNLTVELNNYVCDLADADKHYIVVSFIMSTYLAARDSLQYSDVSLSEVLGKWKDLIPTNGEESCADQSRGVAVRIDLERRTHIKDEMPLLAMRKLKTIGLKNFDRESLGVALSHYLTSPSNTDTCKNTHEAMLLGAFFGHTVVMMLNGIHCGEHGRLYDISYSNPNLDEDLDAYLVYLAAKDDRYDFIGLFYNIYYGVRLLRLDDRGYQKADINSRSWASQLIRYLDGSLDVPVF